MSSERFPEDGGFLKRGRARELLVDRHGGGGPPPDFPARDQRTYPLGCTREPAGSFGSFACRGTLRERQASLGSEPLLS